MAIKDIYEGDVLGVWEDDEAVFLSFYPNACTLSFPKEHWDEVKKELRDLVKGQLVVLEKVKNKRKRKE